MKVSVAILLGWAVGGLVFAWYSAIARFYRSEMLAALSEGPRVVIAALVGFVFVVPVTLVGCWYLVSKALPPLAYRVVESEMNTLRQT
jgi:hypothetical protein